LARFNQSGNDLEELAYTGAGELTFTCFDPFAYALTEKTQLSTTQDAIITNAGTVEAYPRFRIVTSVNVPFIIVKNVTTGKSFTYNATWYASTPLIIDTKTNRVYQENTGENFIKYLTLASDFFPLVIGANTLKVETEATGAINQVSSFRTYWTERFY
jgi:phage-related protein